MTPPVTSRAQTRRAGGSTPQTHGGRVVAVLVISAFVVILNETITGVALPELMRDLDIPASRAQWLTTGYLLTMAAVIPATGFLLERFNVRTMYLAAMGLFIAGTIIAAISPGFGLLLAGRVVQAGGTAIMMPLLITTVLNIVPSEHRGRMMGTITIVISVAPAIGPTIAGLILSFFDWRWLFLLILPIAGLVAVVGAIFVRNVTHPRRIPVSPVSIVLAALGFGGLIFGLSSIGEAVGKPQLVPFWIPIVAGVLLLVAFVLLQLRLQRSDRALLDLRTLRHRPFAVTVGIVIVSMATMFGTLILLPIYLQGVLKLNTLETGLILLPGGVLMGALAPFVGILYDRFGPRPLVITGTVIISGALWWMATLDQSTSVPLVIGMHVALSVGLAAVITPLYTSGLSSLPRRLYSHGSATLSTIHPVAGAAGTALYITVMTVVSAGALTSGAGFEASLSAGVGAALTVGAILSTVMVLLALLVRKPAASTDEGPVTGYH